MDNSPAWDAALARVPTQTVTPIRRRDTTHVDASMRPRGEEYQRFIHLVDCFRDVGWEPMPVWFAVSPFRVADIATNAILLRAERDLLALAGRFGSAAEQSEIAGRIERMERAIGGLWHQPRGIFVSRDLISGAAIDARHLGRPPSAIRRRCAGGAGPDVNRDTPAMGSIGTASRSLHRTRTIRASSRAATGAVRSGRL